jgi:hypothetical protein
MKMGEVRRVQMLLFIETYSNKHGYAPTIAEVAEYIECSPSAAYRDLLALRACGRLKWEAGLPRTMRVVGRA